MDNSRVRQRLQCSTDCIDKFQEKAILRLVNKFAVVKIEKLTEDQISTFSKINYTQLIRPLVFEDHQNGGSLAEIAIRWNININSVRHILGRLKSTAV